MYDPGYLFFDASCKAAEAAASVAAATPLPLPLLLVVLAMGFAVDVRLGAIRPELVDRC